MSSTVFPYNQIPKIVLTIIPVVVPLILDQRDLVDKIIDRLERKLLGLPKRTKCGDAVVNDLKKELERLKRIAESLQKIADNLPPILTTLQTIAAIGQILIGISLAQPTAPGQPTTPPNQKLIALAELLKNIQIILTILQTITAMLPPISRRLLAITSKTEATIKSICGDELNTSANSDANVSTTSQTSLSDPQLNSNYPSEFYQDINVSNEDLQGRINQIQDLLNQQKDIVENLIEAPSKVITGNGAPSADLGNISDYYIDTDNQTIYGPKSTQNSWS